jgi:archaellum component FlaC
MTPLELLAILVLAGAIVVLLYYYMQDTRNQSLLRARSIISETGEKARSSVSSATENMEGNNVGGIGDKMSGMGEKARSAVSGASEKVTIEGSMIDGVSEKMAGMSEKIKGTVKGVPKSTDVLSSKIELFLDDKSDQLIKDWELATKTDVIDLEKRYSKVTRDLGELDGRFNEYRGFTNKKLKKIEERLEKLENPENKI